MPLVTYFRSAFIKAHVLMPLIVEFCLCILSGRAAYILLTNQSYFDNNEKAYAWLVEHITHDEWQLGLLALAACVFKSMGLACLFQPSDKVMELAFALREVGWGLSFIFWTLIGITFCYGNPSNLSAGNALFVALLALNTMIAGPIMPADRKYNDYE